MKIVAWRMGFAGDVLFSTAALEAIKRKYRRSEVTYGVWAQYANLIATNPYIDKFVHSDGVEDKVVGTDEMGYPIVRKVVRKDGLEYAKRQAHKVWEISHEKYTMPQGEMIYWGMGYCHAMDRGMQMLIMRILGQGRAAELLEEIQRSSILEVLDAERAAVSKQWPELIVEAKKPKNIEELADRVCVRHRA